MIPEEMMTTLLEPGFNGDSEFAGQLGNDLLSEFGKGFPKENIERLLDSPNPWTQATAAFLMTFFGFELHPYVSKIALLLKSKNSRARFDTLEILLDCTTPDDGAILGEALLLLDDEHPGIRWAAAKFICMAQPWQLRLAVRHAALLRPGSAFSIMAEAHDQHLFVSQKKIRELIRHSDSLVRRFGAALAARPRLVVDERLLHIASESNDPEVAVIIKDAREGFMGPMYAILSSKMIGTAQ